MTSLLHLPDEVHHHIYFFGLLVQDLCNLSETCQGLHHVIASNSGSADVLWRLFVCRDFNLTPPQVRLFMVEHVSIRRLYVSYALSKISVLGIPFPFYKRVAKERINYFKKANDIQRFWILHLYHTNNRTRRVAAWTEEDHNSHFKKILRLNEIQRLQIEGTRKVQKGAYRVIWRIKLLNDYWLGQVSFLTSVLKEEQNKSPLNQSTEKLIESFKPIPTKEIDSEMLTPLQRSDLMSLNQREEQDKVLENQVLSVVRTRSQKREVMDTVSNMSEIIEPKTEIITEIFHKTLQTSRENLQVKKREFSDLDLEDDSEDSFHSIKESPKKKLKLSKKKEISSYSSEEEEEKKNNFKKKEISEEEFLPSVQFYDDEDFQIGKPKRAATRRKIPNDEEVIETTTEQNPSISTRSQKKSNLFSPEKIIKKDSSKKRNPFKKNKNKEVMEIENFEDDENLSFHNEMEKQINQKEEKLVFLDPQNFSKFRSHFNENSENPNPFHEKFSELNRSNPNSLKEQINSETFQKFIYDFGDNTTVAQTQIPTNEWFDVLVGEIVVPNDGDKVWFGMNHWGLDWKYSVELDYVALVPISMSEYREIKEAQERREREEKEEMERAEQEERERVEKERQKAEEDEMKEKDETNEKELGEGNAIEEKEKENFEENRKRKEIENQKRIEEENEEREFMKEDDFYHSDDEQILTND